MRFLVKRRKKGFLVKFVDNYVNMCIKDNLKTNGHCLISKVQKSGNTLPRKDYIGLFLMKHLKLPHIMFHVKHK